MESWLRPERGRARCDEEVASWLAGQRQGAASSISLGSTASSTRSVQGRGGTFGGIQHCRSGNGNPVYVRCHRQPDRSQIHGRCHDVGGNEDIGTHGPGGRRYYQVSESVRNPDTLRRELSALRAVRDNYPKTLITLDDERPVSHEGIEQVYALNWLVGERS